MFLKVVEGLARGGECLTPLHYILCVAHALMHVGNIESMRNRKYREKLNDHYSEREASWKMYLETYV